MCHGLLRVAVLMSRCPSFGPQGPYNRVNYLCQLRACQLIAVIVNVEARPTVNKARHIYICAIYVPRTIYLTDFVHGSFLMSATFGRSYICADQPGVYACYLYSGHVSRPSSRLRQILQLGRVVKALLTEILDSRAPVWYTMAALRSLSMC